MVISAIFGNVINLYDSFSPSHILPISFQEISGNCSFADTVSS